MAFVFKKRLIYKLLFALCLAVPYLGSYELTFLLWSFTIVLSLQKRYSITFAKYTFCFVLILILSFLATNFEKAKPFLIIRDITYLLKPVLGLLVGYQLCRFNYKDGFKSIVYIGLTISIVHLIVIAVTIVRFNSVSLIVLREYAGYFSDFEVYALIILIFHEKFQIHFTKKTFYLYVIIIGLSSFLYLARTNLIQFIILVMALKGLFVLNKRAIMALSTVILAGLISYGTILYINPKRNGQGLEALLYKIKMAPIEPFKSKIDFDDYKDFNDNYRSVELKLTLKQVPREGWQYSIYGKGLGSQVDLKREVYLGDIMRYISVVHNSFMTVYLKSGIIGILILIYSIYLLFNQKKSAVPINKQINFLLIGTSIFLIISNWVLMGYYFTDDSKSIIVGFLIAYKEITDRKHQAGLTT